MTLQQLNCFLEVAKNLSFMRAAENLFISQPAVTHHINALEKELGCRLFERDRQHVSLTSAGSRFYLEVSDVMEQLDRATILLQSNRDLPEILNIGFENTIEIYKLPDILAQYIQTVPNVRFYFHGVDLGEAVKMFSSNHLDILFTTCSTINIPDEHFYPLFSGQFCCVVRKDDPLAQKEKILFEDLENRTMIFADKRCCAPEMAALQRKLHMKIPSIKVHFSTSAHYSIPMVVSGLGIVLLPNFLFSPHIEVRGQLKSIPLEPAVPAKFGLMTHKAAGAKKISEFVKITRAFYSNKSDCVNMKQRKSSMHP